MLPSEYDPLKLTARQQEVHRRYTAMGFKICPRPFAGKGDHLWFFMSLPAPEVPRGIEFTINLQSGIAHRTGTQTTYEMEAAEKEFGGVTGERQGDFENPPCEVAVAAPVVMEAAPSPVKEDHAKPPAREEKPVRNSEETRGLTPLGSPEKRVPVKKKQTALF